MSLRLFLWQARSERLFGCFFAWMVFRRFQGSFRFAGPAQMLAWIPSLRVRLKEYLHLLSHPRASKKKREKKKKSKKKEQSRLTSWNWSEYRVDSIIHESKASFHTPTFHDDTQCLQLKWHEIWFKDTFWRKLRTLPLPKDAEGIILSQFLSSARTLLREMYSHGGNFSKKHFCRGHFLILLIYMFKNQSCRIFTQNAT